MKLQERQDQVGFVVQYIFIACMFRMQLDDDLGKSTEQLPKNLLKDGDEVVTAVIAGSSQVGEDLDIGFSLLTEHSQKFRGEVS